MSTIERSICEVIDHGQALTDDAQLLQQLSEVGAEMESALDAEIQRRQDEKGGSREHPDWNWASDVGHPCKRQLVYARLNGKDREAPDLDSLWRFLEGNDIERKAKVWLSEAGWELTQAQRQLRSEELKVSGRIDGLQAIRKKFLPPFEHLREVPAEIKSINPNYWQSTRTIEDVRRNRGWWIRKYISQLNLYAYLLGAPGGFLILVTFGKRPRILPMLLDQDLLRGDLARIEDVNRHVAARTYPEPIPYDSQICGMCDFAHICQPVQPTNMVTVDEGDIPLLRHYLDLKEWAERFEDFKKKLIGDKRKPGKYYGQNAIVEDIQISSRDVHRKGYVVQESDYTVTQIERIG